MYNINEVQVSAVKKITQLRPDLNKHQILRILSKALGFKSFGHLKRCFEIDKEGNIYEKESLNCYDIPLNIPHYGLLFNVYILMKELKISFEKALGLKRRIDKHSDFLLASNGNINYSDLVLVKIGLEKLISGENTRLMAKRPLSFYCRREEKFLLPNPGIKADVSFIWFDGFNPCDKRYFKGKKNFLDYIVRFMTMFLEYDNVIFWGELVEGLKEHENEILEFLLKKFKHHSLYIPGRLGNSNSIIFAGARFDSRLIHILQ